ncbi:MAG: superoxide dismutase [Chitinophagaceae bacterium]|nr:superoxide dismutase [Chitinophagaceae bacterium]
MERSKNSRRKFLGDTAKAGLALTSLVALPSYLTAAGIEKDFPSPDSNSFAQDPLRYGYDALEAAIDAKTMEIHYIKHAAAYTKNLNEAAATEKIDTSRPLEDVLKNVSKYSAKVRNNGGGHYNHELFWKLMKKDGEGKPSGKLLAAIEHDFGSFDAFRSKFTDAAKTRFGSGWAWLLVASDKKLVVASTPNQDNPLMDVSEVKGYPLLGLDVWEHAYYLKYQNKRPDYIDAWWSIVNWDFVQQRFEKNI